MFIAWAESYLVHGEGDLLGKPYRVPLWLKRAAFRILEFDPSSFDDVTGSHSYIVREVLIVCPKGSAKTEGMAALALFLLAGPSVPTPAGPVMRTAPNIPVGAASREQAGKLFNEAAVSMAEGTTDSPAPLAPFVECFDSEIQLRGAKGKIYKVAAVAGTNDGGLPTAGFADEVHEWTGRKKRVHLVLFQGLDKRHNGIACNITTPDAADPESLLGEKVAYAQRVASGEVDDPGFYFLHYGAPLDMPLSAPPEVTDPAERFRIEMDLVAAAVAAAHPADWMDPRKIARKLLVDLMPLHEFRRYWLGQFARGEGHWLPEGAWEARQVGTWEKDGDDWPPEGTSVVLGFDGSYRRDSTALIGCTLEGYVFVVKVWEKPDGAKDSWKVPRTEVKAVVAEAMRRWVVEELAPDPPGWHDEIEGWEEEYEDVVVRFETKSTSEMSVACTRFYAAAAGGEEAAALIPLTHGGHPVLARHLRNAVVKKTPSGEVITKENPDSPLKIDAAIAAVVARERAEWRARNAEEDVDLSEQVW